MNNVSVQGASVTAGTGSVSNFNVAGNQVTVDLNGVTNVQTIVVTLATVSDGINTSDVQATMGVLVGGVNGSGRVDAADVSLVRQQSLGPLITSNFREDINASGRIDAADVSVARQQALTSLPAPSGESPVAAESAGYGRPTPKVLDAPEPN
jgi:Dockerin type I domain